MILMFLFVLASVSHYSPVRGAPMSTENGSGEGGLISESILILSHSQNISQITTGGPPLTRKSLTRFPLPRFLAYVCVSGGIRVSRGPQYSPTNTNYM